MCGLVGVVNSDPFKDTDIKGFVRDALITGAVRGQDSTGLFQIDRPKEDSKLYWYKAATVGNSFIYQKDVGPLINDAHNSFITAIHHRAATQGKVAAENAHPFTFDINDKQYIVASHNGTLTHWNQKESGEEFAVDSAWAIWRMSKYGIKETLTDLRGAFAFSIYDQREPGVFQLVTNGDRPLHFGLIASRKTVLYASEPEMLAWIAKRNKLALKDNVIFECEKNVIYKFDAKDPHKYEKERFTPRSWPAERSSAYDYTKSNYRGRQMGNSYDPTTSVSQKLEEIMQEIRRPKSKGKSADVIALPPENDVVATTRKFAQGAELVTLTRDMEIPVNSEVLFEPISYQKVTKALYGKVLVSTPSQDKVGELDWEEMQGLIRNVTEEMYDKVKSMNTDYAKLTLSCRAIGAYFRTDMKDKSSPLLDPVIVCSVPEEIKAGGVVAGNA